jgi:hypothetical protein
MHVMNGPTDIVRRDSGPPRWATPRRIFPRENWGFRDPQNVKKARFLIGELTENNSVRKESGS